MSPSAPFLSPSEAARRLGVSVKALRLYEAHGLLRPFRSAAGWRTYGLDAMALATRVVALRKLGLGFGQIARVLDSADQDLDPTLAAHQAALETQLCELSGMVEGVRDLRANLTEREAPRADPIVAFDLPWPWGGERFELYTLPPISFITGPLGCGKTRLALRLAEVIPGAVVLPMERAADDLVGLLAGLEAEGRAAIVIDMVEQGSDQAAQVALMASLRQRGPDARPLLLMTRSNAILDLALVEPGEVIIFCPANHSPPVLVEPRPGAPGYEALASCLASPEVRARTEGMVAWRPQAA